MLLEFEEKTYEQYHNCELSRQEEVFFFTPGQVLEGTLGFDAAFLLPAILLSQLYGSASSGLSVRSMGFLFETILSNENWNRVEEYINRFPECRFNLFIQYKRSEYLSRANAREYRYWGRPYYRYSLSSSDSNSDNTINQWRILCELEQYSGNRALVVYAAPAFHRIRHLIEFFRNGQIIDNSNYMRPSSLEGHSKWTYIEGGWRGRAFSKPEDIESLDLRREIEKVRNQIKEKYESNSDFIKITAQMINRSIAEDSILSQEFKVFKRLILEHVESSFGRAIITIFWFTQRIKVTWGVGLSL